MAAAGTSGPLCGCYLSLASTLRCWCRCQAKAGGAPVGRQRAQVRVCVCHVRMPWLRDVSWAGHWEFCIHNQACQLPELCVLLGSWLTANVLGCRVLCVAVGRRT
jgi:hypothetical protein